MTLPKFERDLVRKLLVRINEQRGLMQVVTGPRQVGKTTAVHQALQAWPGKHYYTTADLPAPPQAHWIEQQWEVARLHAREGKPVLLVLDEVQKISRWSEVVKRNWDEDTREGRDIRVIILGSSALLVQAGLTESLAGRFEILHATHWYFQECQACFDWDLDTFLYFGGYPGAAALIEDETRWAQYVRDSLIETALSKDILLLNRVEKPALLRQLCILAAEYSGQILSYQKLMGQLQDAGNTTTLAHYQNLLQGAGLLYGVPKWHGKVIRRRASSPKWLAMNTALMTTTSGLNFEEWRKDSVRWGRLVETAVGAHMINSALGTGIEVFYWRDHNREVDFVLKRGNHLLAIEVKSGLFKKEHIGLKSFSQKFPESQILLVGKEGISIEEFLSRPVRYWFH
ncbi:MAG: ATP-binding protein [bacterium]